MPRDGRSWASRCVGRATARIRCVRPATLPGVWGCQAEVLRETGQHALSRVQAVREEVPQLATLTHPGVPFPSGTRGAGPAGPSST